ncbi:MAG: Ig-like domain-containing protein [Chitinophagaceae bacterium]
MKRNFTLMVSAWILIASTAIAQTGDNFNSRTGVSLSQVKSYLQDQCWIFNDFDVNDSWTPAIEGNGAMVSAAAVTSTSNTGIYTPVLDVWGEITVSFKYKLNATLASGERRWLKIYLTDAEGMMTGDLLDSVEIKNFNTGTTYEYSKTFYNVGSGPYKLFLNYRGIGGSTRIAIDQLTASVPLWYPHTCNDAPVAVYDAIAGSADRKASGKVTTNDHDPNNEGFNAYLVQGSPDGTVVLNTDGTFTFTPNPGFIGEVTVFSYRICDFGFPSQCSNETNVVLTFPVNTVTLPVGLTDFKGLYKNDGVVELSWNTGFEQNSSHFEVERSIDGAAWQTVGTVKAIGNSVVTYNYNFIDNAGRNTANKKDLYYRLKQVDLDGKSVYSRVLIVRVYNTRTLKMVSVSPNPAKNDISVTVQLNEQAVVSMRIFNIQGMEALRKTVKCGEGSNSFTVEGSSKLTPGMYMLEVTINSKERMLVKLIKE